MNFYVDWILYLRAMLDGEGLRNIASLSDIQIEMAYFNLLFRAIDAKPRRCFVSRELVVPAKYKKRFSKLKQAVISGGNLNVYLSKLLLDPLYNDMLLNHWGLHHFHLGRPLSDSLSFTVRTDELLFARVTDEAIYFIQILDHKAFADQELLEILYRNWPDLLKQYELKGLLPGNEMPTPTETIKLRKAGVVVPIKLSNNKLYISPSLGFASSGISNQVMNRISRFRHWLGRAEQSTHDFLSTDHRYQASLGNFRFVVEPDGYYAINHDTRVRIKLADADAPVA